MNNNILYIGNSNITKYTKEIKDYIDANISPFDLIQMPDIDSSYDSIFNSLINLIVIESDIPGCDEFIQIIKNEDMSKHIQILVVLKNYNLAKEKETLMLGADSVINLEQIQHGLLLSHIRPLVINSLLIAEKIDKSSVLQDNAINDFILLDLIKAYIPKTIWKIALDCANKQQIHIPEAEVELTIVFGDIKGFTKMSQHQQPKDVIKTLNIVYDIVTRHIYQNDGDIDKFLGDAFFGIFENAFLAVKSMVLIQKEIEELNKKRVEQNIPEIRFRIGVHTGPVIRGNVGGNERFDNTLIGDTVNTASRLEHIAPVGDIVISDATKIKANLDIPDKYMSTVELRGKDISEQIYTVYEYLKDDPAFC